MRSNVRLFRGEIHCGQCFEEGQKSSHSQTNLYLMDDGTYRGICSSHLVKVVDDDTKEGSIDYKWVREHLAATEECFHIPWRDVVKLTLHKPDPNAYDRSGDVVTVQMKDVPNKDLMRQHSIEVLHGLQLMADSNATIHDWLNGTEQNHCWTNTNYHWDEHVEGTIRDKYWGKQRIANFHKLCRVMAEIHKWELEDETIDLLDRIAKAVDRRD